MHGRTVDFGGIGVGGVGGKEDKKALLDRARAEREARARTQVLSAKALILQRFARRIVARARCRSELRSRLEQAWTVYTTALARRTAALKEQPEFEAGLFVAEGPALEKVARWIGLLERCKARTSAAGEGLLILSDDSPTAAAPPRPPRTRAPSKSSLALQSADELKQLSLCAAIVKGTMDKSAGAERHNFFGGAAADPAITDPATAAAAASSRAASSASAIAAPAAAAFSCPSWLRCCESLVRVLLARLLRDSAAGSPKDVKSFALITSCLCTILDPTRWNVPGSGSVAAAAAGASPTPAAAAAVSASAVAAPSSPAAKPSQPQCSAPISACYKELMLRLLLRVRLFTHMRRLLMQLCYPPAASLPVPAVSISASSSSASSKATAAATAAAVALVVSQRPVAFINALLTSCVRIVELCSFLPVSAVPSRGSAAPSAVPFLLAEPAYLFAAHILSIPTCHSALTPAMVATIMTARPSSVAPAATASPSVAAASASVSLWSVLYSALHQLLLPSAYQSGSYFLSRAPPPVFLDGSQWERLQSALPQWATYDSIVLGDGSSSAARGNCVFNVPAQVHVLSTLCWLTIHHAPLSAMDSIQLHLWMAVSAALLRAFPPVLLGVVDSGRLDLISLLSEREDDESRFERAHGVLDNSPPALFVRAGMLTNLEVLFRQSSIATVMNHMFLRGHALLQEAGDTRLGNIEAFRARLKAFGLIEAPPSETELFMRTFHAYTESHPLYFSALLTLLKALTSLRSASVSTSSSAGVAAAGSKMLRTNGLSWLTFSTPFLACVWEELQRRMGCELSEDGNWERMDAGAVGSTTGAAAGSKEREKKESASAALRAFFGFKPSSSSSSSSSSNGESVFVTNRNRWEVAILTSRSGGGGGLNSPQQQPGVEAGVTDLFLLWLSFFAPILFILEDSELLSKLPALSPPRIGTLVSLVHLLKMIVFRLIYNKYEPRRGHGGSQSQIDYELYSDLLAPAQTLLRELYQRDVRRGFMHLAEVERTELAKAAAREAAASKAEAAAERKRKPQAATASYAALETEMDSLAPAGAGVAASSVDPSSLLSAPALAVTDAASLDARAQHWMLSSGSGGLASRGELATFEQEFEIWARGGVGADGDAGSADLFDPSSAHSQRLFHLLHAMPFILSFSRREALLRSFIRADSLKHGYAASDAAPARPLFEITLRRDHVVADGLAAVSRLGSHFRSKLRVKFLEANGAEERGIDLGGPFKEFLEQVTREVFRVEYGLFTRTEPESSGSGGGEQGMYYPSPAAPFLHGPEAARDLFVSIGRIVGKALYDNILLDIPLASFFLARFIGQGLVLADLQEMDPRLFKSLMQVKNYPGDVRDLCLNFTVSRGEMEQSAAAASSSSSSSSSSSPDPNVVELLSNGASIDVTNANRLLYIYKLADYHLTQKLSLVVGAFLSGLGDIVDLRWFRLFNTIEMRMILSGNISHGINVGDWRKHTVYEEGCSANSKVVLWFWEVVESLSEADKSALLKFATSCSRPPLQGFKDLHPPFTMRVIPVVEAPPPASGAKSGGFFRNLFSSRPNAAQLPSAATCFNTFKLPKYASKSVLAEKLKMAIQNNTGFHLT